MISDIVKVGIHLGKETRFEWENLAYFPFSLFAVFLFLARQNTKVPKGTPATDIALKSVQYVSTTPYWMANPMHREPPTSC